MTRIAQVFSPTARASDHVVATCPLALGDPIDARAFAQIRRRMMLECCKWDPQVGDVATLADYPLIVRRDAWETVAALAEQLADELSHAERELMHRPELWSTLGIQRSIRSVLKSREQTRLPAVRTLRFDFHWTESGWQISEVNSDVPGGYAEGSAFPRFMADEISGAEVVGDPAAAWADAFEDALSSSSAANVALLVAPGFMEDQQVVRFLGHTLGTRGIATHFADARSLQWSGRDASLNVGENVIPISGIVRFFQAEWLTRLPRAAWRPFFLQPNAVVTNPATAIFTESKRFPLVWPRLSTPLTTWRRLLPETRDPREVNCRGSDEWILKSAFCNTGDTVAARSLVNVKRWRAACRSAQWFPNQWIAQRRFQTVGLANGSGELLYPCLGVFTINGKAAGAYARLSKGPIVDYRAIDAAVLMLRDTGGVR